MRCWVAAVLLVLLNATFSFAAPADACQTFPWNVSSVKTALTVSCRDDPADKISACSLMRNGCEDASADACNATKIIAALCVDQPQLPECARLLEEYPTAVATSCLQQLALPLPSSASLLQNAQQLCAADSALPGCVVCKGNDCENPLVSLMMSCPYAQNSPSCANLTKFCSDMGPASLPAVCQAPSRAAAATPQCVVQSSKPECRSYQPPEDLLDRDLENLCKEMPDMPVCTLHKLCASGAAKGPNCSNMQLLATGCAEMPGMSDCNNYNKLCGKDSVVEQCKQEPALSQLPDTRQTRTSILSSCSTHFMPSCKTCTNELKTDACPDPFTSLSKLCQEHPSMSACQLLYNFCTGSVRTTFPTLCPSSGSSEVLPSMMQYLHQRVDEVVLFRGWVTRSNGAYAGTIIAIVLFGIVSQFLKTLRSVLDAKWMVKTWTKNSSSNTTEADSVSSLLSLCFMSLLMDSKQMKRNIVRTALTAVILTLDYWNMLICMTFNVGLFLAVIGGYCIGTFFFSHVVEILRYHTKQPVESTFYENGAAPLASTDLDEAELVKGPTIKALPFEACGCEGLTGAQLQQVVQMNLVNRCEGCA